MNILGKLLYIFLGFIGHKPTMNCTLKTVMINKVFFAHGNFTFS